MRRIFAGRPTALAATAVVAILTALLTGACERAAQHAGDAPARIGVGQRMGGTPDPGFARAIAPRAFVFPRDHGAHPAFATEWWYFTGNLRDPDGRRFGYQFTLFRIGLTPGAPLPDSDWRATQLYMGHFALSDVAERTHRSAERFSRAAAGLAGAGLQPLRVWLGPWSIRGGRDDLFPLRLQADTADFAIELSLAAGDKPVVLQGERGLSRKSAAAGNASYYYSFTRLPTSGRIRVGEQHFAVDGWSWFDREWSSSALAADQAGWDWLALQLDDGRELMFYRLRGRDGRAQRFSRGVLVERDGRVQPLSFDTLTLTPTRHWRSGDGTAYPVDWRLKADRHGLDLQIQAAFDDQEMAHSVRYWEGAVSVSGSHRGQGYLELAGYAD